MWIVKFVLIVIVMSVVLLVAGLNASQTVDLNLLFKEYQKISVVLVILLSFICGMFVTLLISVFREMQLKSRIRHERKSRTKAERELIGLRNQPLEETVPVKKTGEPEKAREENNQPAPPSEAVAEPPEPENRAGD